MNKTKKFLALVLMACMLFALAACTAQTTVAPTTAATTAATTQATTAAKDYSKHYKIEYALSTTNLKVNDDDFAKYWNTKFNAEYEIIALTAENANEMIRIWVSAGDMPDVVRWDGFNYAEYADWVDQKLIKELPAGWQTKYPNLANSQVDTGMADALAKRVGGYYAIGAPIYSTNKPIPTLLSHMGLWMRADWVKAVGVELKDYYKIDEVLDIARKIKAQDPGKVGAKLVPIDVPTGNLPNLFMANALHASSTSQFYQDDKGVFKWGFTDPEVLDGLKRWRAAYDEGLLHPEFYTLPVGRENEADLNTAGIAAMNIAAGMATVGTRQGGFIEANLKLDPFTTLTYAFVIGDDGVYRANEQSNWFSARIFSPKIDAGLFDRVLDITDYSCTDEAQVLIRMGFENIDWQKKATGEVVSLLPANQQVPQKYFSVQPFYTSYLVLSDNFQLVNPTLPQIWRDKARNQYILKNKLTNEKNFAKIDLDVFFYTSDARKKATFDLPKEFATIVMKGKDVESAYNAFLKDKMPLVQPLLDELTAMKKK